MFFFHTDTIDHSVGLNRTFRFLIDLILDCLVFVRRKHLNHIAVFLVKNSDVFDHFILDVEPNVFVALEDVDGVLADEEVEPLEGEHFEEEDVFRQVGVDWRHFLEFHLDFNLAPVLHLQFVAFVAFTCVQGFLHENGLIGGFEFDHGQFLQGVRWEFEYVHLPLLTSDY